MPVRAASGVNDQLTEEDAKYLLRSLELDAFTSCVSALRAQGPLTDYKRALLEHCRAALIIPLDHYRAEVRRATNDEVLSSVATKLNPVSDSYYDWAEEGRPSIDLKNEPRDFDRINDTNKQLADKLRKQIVQHNATLSTKDEALLNLLTLPKKAQVPEALRAVLRYSEEVSSKEALKRSLQIPVVAESNETAPTSVIKKRKKPSKAHNAVDGNVRVPPDHQEQTIEAVVDGEMKLANDDESKQSAAPSSVSPPIVDQPTKKRRGKAKVSAVAGSNSGDSKPAPTRKPRGARAKAKTLASVNEAECAAIDSLLKLASEQQQQQQIELLTQAVLNPLPTAVGSKEDTTTTCARVQPFLFAKQNELTGEKQTRGNPDKRSSMSALAGCGSAAPSSSTKRTVTSFPTARVVAPSAAVLQHPITTVRTLGGGGKTVTVMQSASSSALPIATGIPLKRRRAVYSTVGVGAPTGDYGVVNSGSVIRQTAIPYYSRSYTNVNTGTIIGSPRYAIAQSAAAASAALQAAAYSSPARTYYGNPSAAAAVGMKTSVIHHQQLQSEPRRIIAPMTVRSSVHQQQSAMGASVQLDVAAADTTQSAGVIAPLGSSDTDYSTASSYSEQTSSQDGGVDQA